MMLFETKFKIPWLLCIYIYNIYIYLYVQLHIQRKRIVLMLKPLTERIFLLKSKSKIHSDSQ